MKLNLSNKTKSAICILLPLVLCSCSGKEETSIATDTNVPKQESKTEEKQTTLFDTLNITQESFLSAIDTDNTFITERPYTYDDYTVEWYRNQQSTIKILTFIEPNKSEISALSFITEGANDVILSKFIKYFTDSATLCGVDEENLIDKLVSTEKAKKDLSEKDYSEITSNNIICRYEVDRENNYYILKIYPVDTTLDVDSLPVKVARENDFFTSEENQKLYSEYLEKHQYTEILALVENYISESSPKETDSAFIIKEKIQPLISEMANCNIVADDFDGQVYIYYNGLTEINAKNNVVTFIEGTSVKNRVGFINNDWIFFETAKIKTDDGIIDTSQRSSVRDVLNGGNIIEYCDSSFNSDEVEKIANSNSVTIRFEGKDGKTLDHTLTADEINAIKIMPIITKTYVFLSDLKYHWVNS
jgi:hypothetical protein